MPSSEAHRRAAARRHRPLADEKFDPWDDDGVRFVFGVDVSDAMRSRAEVQPESPYETLVRESERHISPSPLRRPNNVKQHNERERPFTNLRIGDEQVVAFACRVNKWRHDDRVIPRCCSPYHLTPS